MSDFDKEAERERLREKYERDEEKREVTERMSELLLKGATMTNAHCEVCGDPIFRYDGQEFCATCERAVERPSQDEAGAAADEPTDEGAEDAATNGDGEEIEVATPSEETRVQFGGEGDGETGDAESGPGTGPEAADAGTGAPDQIADAGADSPDPSVDAREAQHKSTSQPESRRRSRAAGGDENLHAARASLERTLATLTSQAEACDDPRDAEAYLAAAREAAETLAALRR